MSTYASPLVHKGATLTITTDGVHWRSTYTALVKTLAENLGGGAVTVAVTKFGGMTIVGDLVGLDGTYIWLSNRELGIRLSDVERLSLL